MRLRASWTSTDPHLTIEEFSRKLYEANKDFYENPNMYDCDRDFFTNERVAPAVGERSHVEQQAEVEHVQLSKEVP